jgi:hypothetical protein
MLYEDRLLEAMQNSKSLRIASDRHHFTDLNQVAIYRHPAPPQGLAPQGLFKAAKLFAHPFVQPSDNTPQGSSLADKGCSENTVDTLPRDGSSKRRGDQPTIELPVHRAPLDALLV